jgi:hypothetical protein
MNKYIATFGFVLVLFLVSFSAKAAFIVDGYQSVGVLSINESFESFYSYNSPVGGSSNTGYEINDTVVMFLVEFGNSYALVGLVDGTIATGDTTNGLMFLTLNDLAGPLGALIVSDDIADSDIQGPNTIKFTFGFAAEKNDGFVYSLGSADNVDLTVAFQYVRGLSDAVFLSFEDGLVSDQIVLGNSATIQGSAPSVSVHSPSIIGLFALGILFVVSRKNKSIMI